MLKLLQERINVNSFKPNDFAVSITFQFAGFNVIADCLNRQFEMCGRFLDCHPFICNHDNIIACYRQLWQIIN